MITAKTASLPSKAVPQSPSAGPLFLVAMPDGPGFRLATRVCQAIRDLAPTVFPAVRAAAEIGSLMRDHTSARFAVFVDSPLGLMARMVQDGSLGNTGEALTSWRMHARALLRSVQAAPLRCLCLDVVEASAAAAALADSLTRWLALSAPLPSQVLIEANDTPASAIALTLAQQAVLDNPQTAKLFDELRACCVVLSETDGSASLAGVSQATHEYLALIERTRSATRHAEDLQARLDRTTAERVAAQRDLAAAEEEAHELLKHLHQAQEQLEYYYEQCRRFELVGAHGIARPALRAAQVRSVSSHDQPPHRHRHFRLDRVQFLDRVIAALEVRLVEHLGRPGMALFRMPGGAPPISAWQPSGLEGAGEFMLVVPSDRQGKRLLQPLGSADWMLVSGLASLMQRELLRAGREVTDWGTIANRLCRELADLPPRLRYDRLAVEPVGVGDESVLRVRFENALFADITFDELILQWQPHSGSSGQGQLVWQTPAESGLVPLSVWPANDRGGLRSDWPLPVGPTVCAAAKRREWSALSAFDRDLVLAVIDALPAAAAQVPAKAMPHCTPTMLARQAARLHKDARRLLTSLAWRSFVRRLLRSGDTLS